MRKIVIIIEISYGYFVVTTILSQFNYEKGEASQNSLLEKPNELLLWKNKKISFIRENCTNIHIHMQY